VGAVRPLNDYPKYVVVREDGRYFQEYYAVGFLREVDGRGVRDPKRASKFPRTIARLIAVERGGVATAVRDLAPALPPAP
jgi:hypothetical protein